MPASISGRIRKHPELERPMTQVGACATSAPHQLGVRVVGDVDQAPTGGQQLAGDEACSQSYAVEPAVAATQAETATPAVVSARQAWRGRSRSRGRLPPQDAGIRFDRGATLRVDLHALEAREVDEHACLPRD